MPHLSAIAGYAKRTDKYGAVRNHRNSVLPCPATIKTTLLCVQMIKRAMIDNIEKYEAVNGSIQDLEQIEIPMNFGGPTAQA